MYIILYIIGLVFLYSGIANVYNEAYASIIVGSILLVTAIIYSVMRYLYDK